MDTFQKVQLTKRFKTLMWSSGWLLAATLTEHILANLGVLDLPTITFLGMDVNTAIIVGLILTQVSKYIRENASTI